MTGSFCVRGMHGCIGYLYCPFLALSLKGNHTMENAIRSFHKVFR